MRLQGQNTYLRPLVTKDARALRDLRVINREFLRPYEPIAADADFSLAATKSMLAHAEREEADDKSYSFGIFQQDSDILVGRIRVTNVFRGPWQNANLGYYVGEVHNGRGHATEAVRLATTFAFRHARLHRVQAGVLTDNERSMRVLIKNEFRREGLALRYLNIAGEWRDHVIFAVTVEEWPHL